VTKARESTYGGHGEFLFCGRVIGNPASLKSRWRSFFRMAKRPGSTIGSRSREP